MKAPLPAVTFARLEHLFHLASELDDAGQRELLDRECVDDEPLRHQVEALLAAEATPVKHCEEAIQQGLDWIATEQPPQRIGPYRVLGELGRGGFSTVYLAQRDDGHFDIQVAIKLVHRHLRSPEILRRLRRERQILANLDHPNIARILDGGSTEDGVPYVVMEHIVGQPIDCHCEGLDLEFRLRLFRQVCAAVQYAHRNLVLHRDIKPSNILVNEAGAVKLVDFGIAKLLHSDGDDSIHRDDTSASRDLLTVLTQPGGQALTPEYASPEQVRGQPLTTAADVYSLGVVLYLLICGQRPYRFQGQGWADIERVICESIPPPPSRVASSSRNETSAPTELDTITAKALHKEPERRYISVEALSEDLRCHLEGLPIEARRDSLTYRAKKFVRRHATAVSLLTLLFLTLVTAVVITRWQALEAQRARQLAEQQRIHAERETVRAEYVARFLEELFEDTDPDANKGRTLTAYQVVERGARRIRREARQDPPLSAALIATMGRVYRRMSLFEEAEELLQVALETHRRSDTADPVREAQTLRDLGILFIDRGDCDRSEAILQQTMRLEISLGEPGQLGLASTLQSLGRSARLCGNATLAEERLHRSLDLDRILLGPEAERVVDSESLLAEVWYANGDYERAESGFQAVLAKRKKTLGLDHPKVAVSLSDTAAVHQAKGDPTSALPLYAEALEIQRQALGERHDSVAQTLFNMATAHSDLQQWQTAKEQLEASLDITRQVYGEEHPWVADCFHELGNVHRYLGDLEIAESFYRRGLDLRQRLFGEEAPLVVASSLHSLASLAAKKNPEEGIALYRQALVLQEGTLADDDFRLTYSLTSLGRLLLARDQADDAEPYLRRALDIRRQSQSEGHWETGLSEYYLGRCMKHLGRIDEARELLTSSHQHLEATLGADDKRTRRTQKVLAAL